ncbi:uncharacterized protein EV420DRAFT_1765251 [Desarmillaria tabescens]|uniref:Uncharacterized protein n=1 Tax=Armillaria tabescens TaxID=1929756 RepID=A0AA39KAB5_ARMTA|nr:uncharacterized protein EV420DRAFT_1765251 [Desarmillaria tabescens]KAK0457178.1 hypothetical protein EV420DRAFT_1765251 [Desarmillaria tabescens]
MSVDAHIGINDIDQPRVTSFLLPPPQVLLAAQNYDGLKPRIFVTDDIRRDVNIVSLPLGLLKISSHVEFEEQSVFTLPRNQHGDFPVTTYRHPASELPNFNQPQDCLKTTYFRPPGPGLRRDDYLSLSMCHEDFEYMYRLPASEGQKWISQSANLAEPKARFGAAHQAFPAILGSESMSDFHGSSSTSISSRLKPCLVNITRQGNKVKRPARNQRNATAKPSRPRRQPGTHSTRDRQK